MNRIMLVVFEGEVREQDYFNSAQRNFFESDKHIIKCAYGNDIYELYREISSDQDLDIVEIIRECGVKNNIHLLDGISREKISEVYLFFDVECQDTGFCEKKLLHMVEFFNEETEHGKLFVSYPMVEALRDISLEEEMQEEFIHRIIEEEKCRGKIYKAISCERGDRKLHDHRKIDKQAWMKIIKSNIQKANHIVYGKIQDHITPVQHEICRAELKTLAEQKKLYVISAYPFFIYEYFGYEQLFMQRKFTEE